MADVIANFIIEDFVSYGQMLLPMLYNLADGIAFFNVVIVGKTLHHMYGLTMADVIAKWQDGITTFLCLRLADVIAMWQDGTATFVLKKRQMLLPGGRCYSH